MKLFRKVAIIFMNSSSETADRTGRDLLITQITSRNLRVAGDYTTKQL